MIKHNWTVLLLRPDYAAGTYGQDTYCARVTATTPEAALKQARKNACAVDEQDTPEDYYCLSCFKGFKRDFVDGQGGVQ